MKSEVVLFVLLGEGLLLAFFYDGIYMYGCDIFLLFNDAFYIIYILFWFNDKRVFFFSFLSFFTKFTYFKLYFGVQVLCLHSLFTLPCCNCLQ